MTLRSVSAAVMAIALFAAPVCANALPVPEEPRAAKVERETPGPEPSAPPSAHLSHTDPAELQRLKRRLAEAHARRAAEMAAASRSCDPHAKGASCDNKPKPPAAR